MSFNKIFCEVLGGQYFKINPHSSTQTGDAVELHIQLSGSGTVTRSPPNLVSNADSTAIYRVGSIVNLTAKPTENSVFSGWGGDYSGYESTCTVAMDSSKKVVANFSFFDEQETPIDSFVDNGDGTVTDTRTGLMWMRFSEGQTWPAMSPNNPPKYLSWNDAIGLRDNFLGYNDWRLPSIDELKTIVRGNRWPPSINLATFPLTPSSVFWSSSVDDDGSHLGLNFLNELIRTYGDLACNCVRLVRDAKLTEGVVGNSDSALSFAHPDTENGLGTGCIEWSLETESYNHSNSPPLSAYPPNGLDATCNVKVDSVNSIAAEFVLPDIPDLEISIANISKKSDLLLEEQVALSPDTAAMLLRIELLEAGLSEVLRKLDALQTVPFTAVNNDTVGNTHAQTLREVMVWLVTQERVSLSVLRTRLLPLDLLPSAVIDELNELALDSIGEPAVEEIGDEIVVVRAVLAEALSLWSKAADLSGEKE